jgi:hypothetical protein
MRYLKIGAVLWVLLGAAASAQQATNTELMAPIQKFIDSFNKGDMAGAAATHAAGPGLAIIDEVPPYHWTGADAFKTWSEALDADAKKNGMTEPKVTVSAPTRVESSGDRAYVVVPAVFTYKLRGVPMREAAQMAFVLQKSASGWLIQGWTWTGPKPKRAAASPKS